MPTYGYKCESCGHELEAFQRMSDAPLRTCPACGAEALRRQVFPVGVLFKGAGFYKTDYAAAKGGDSDGKAAEKLSSSTPEKASEKPSEASTSSAGSDKASKASD